MHPNCVKLVLVIMGNTFIQTSVREISFINEIYASEPQKRRGERNYGDLNKKIVIGRITKW